MKEYPYNKSAVYIAPFFDYKLSSLANIKVIDTFVLNEDGIYDGRFYITCHHPEPETIPFNTQSDRYITHYDADGVTVIEYNSLEIEEDILTYIEGKYTKLSSYLKTKVIYHNNFYYRNLGHKLSIKEEKFESLVRSMSRDLNVSIGLLKEVGELEDKMFLEEESLHFEPNRVPKLLIYPECEKYAIEHELKMLFL